MDLTLLGLFIFTFGSILILPGPNAAFAVGQSLKYGYLNSLAVPLGFMTATGLHAILVFSGLGLIVQKYAIVLVILKWVGVIYLIYLAYKAYTNRPSKIEPSPRAISSYKMFLSAMLVSLTNPKALLASFMIYPLFLNSEYSYIVQALAFSLCAMAVSFSIYSAYSIAASKLKTGVVSSKLSSKVIGGIYLAAAGLLASK